MTVAVRPAWTAAHALARIAPHVPPALVPPRAFAEATALASQLPAALSNWLYLECRLAASAAQTDLAVNVERHQRELLLGLSSAPLPAPFTRHPAWERVRQLATQWADPASALHEALEGVWLEFDADTPAPGVPAVFADFLRAPDPLAGIEGRAGPAEEAVAVLGGGGVRAATALTLRRCSAELPAGAHLLYAGVMLSRADHRVRLCVYGLGAEALLPYLRAVGWPGSPHEIAALTAQLAGAAADRCAPSVLHLDLGDGVLGRLGLEYSLARPDQLRGRVREAPLLDRLVALGLCTPEKRDALLRYPGYEVGVMAHELWPSVIMRRVNHLKVVWAPGCGVEAKAYLCVEHQPRARRR